MEYYKDLNFKEDDRVTIHMNDIMATGCIKGFVMNGGPLDYKISWVVELDKRIDENFKNYSFSCAVIQESYLLKLSNVDKTVRTK